MADRRPPVVRSARWARFASAPFEVAIAVAAVVTGGYLVAWQPALKVTNLAAVAPLWASYAVNVGYLVGGLCMLGGLWRGNRDVEASGLWLLASTLAIGVLILIYVRGGAATASIISQTALAAGSLYRGVMVRRYTMVVVAVPGRDIT